VTAAGSGPEARQDQIRRLRREGGTFRSIAAAAGLAPATIYDLATGRRHPTPNTAKALQKAANGPLLRARVDAGGTRLRLRALHVMGHGSARIARALGVREMTIRRLVRGDAPTVSVPLRDEVIDLYDAWWDKRAPEHTRAERGAATAARRRQLVRRRRPRRRRTRHPRLPADQQVETRHRHRRRPRHHPALPGAAKDKRP
jgi:transcriptional regulator with XRE-family HTH domain